MIAYLIRFGFLVWRFRHGGMRRFRHAKLSKFRSLKWRAVMLIREEVVWDIT